MAKQKADGHDDVPSNTTSGGREPHPAKGAADAGRAEGTAVYPPPVPDRAGERTGNVPPAKQLPPDVPPEENNPKGPQAVLPSKAIADAEAELQRLRAENDDYRRRLGLDRPVARAAGARKFRVTLPGRDPEDVWAEDEAKAEAEYLRTHGIWSPAARPAVAAADGD